MEATRKPIPKTQYQISTEQHVAYDQEQGNPNNAVTPLPIFKNPTDTETVNTYRAYEISEKGDSSKQFTIGLEDHDAAVMYYFDNVIQPFVVQNNEKIPVPIVYGNPERWTTVQKTGYYRDLNAKLMCPMIMFRRTNLQPNLKITSKIDANAPHNYASLIEPYNKSNTYSNFDAVNNRKPVRTFQTVVIPDYVTMSYSCIIWTYYVEQMNKIVESINYAANAYWGAPNSFKFKARIASFDDNTTVATGQERIVRTTFTLDLDGHIIPDIILKDLTAQKKFISKGKVSITSETVGKL